MAGRMYEEMMDERDADFQDAIQVYEDEGVDAYYEYCEENGIEAHSMEALEVFKFQKQYLYFHSSSINICLQAYDGNYNPAYQGIEGLNAYFEDVTERNYQNERLIEELEAEIEAELKDRTLQAEIARTNCPENVYFDRQAKRVVDAIDNATRSIWIIMYSFTSKEIFTALQKAAARHVEVNILLDKEQFHSLQSKDRLPFNNADNFQVTVSYSTPTYPQV